jgi:hypothetical protein
MGYISGQAKGNRQKAIGRINNQFLITRFSITLVTLMIDLDCKNKFPKISSLKIT